MPELAQVQKQVRGNQLVASKKCDYTASADRSMNGLTPKQQMHGNQTIQHLLKSRAAQAKLKIGDPDDEYEREADRVAEQVMRMPEPEKPEDETRQGQGPRSRIQRACSECKRGICALSINKEELVQTNKARGYTPLVSTELEGRINGLQGRGRPLPESMRAFFEPRFGCDFSQVRIHAEGQATEAAHSANARAFTKGHDIVFGMDEYKPETDEGQRLLAHELTHVVQQQKSQQYIQRVVYAHHDSSFRPDAQVCLVHLHADERNALEAARSIHGQYRANLVTVINERGNHRSVEISGPRGNLSCRADPNRIFGSEETTRNCAFGGTCPRDRDRVAAMRDLDANFRPNLIEAINRCRGGRGSERIDNTSPNQLPIIAFHNNAAFNILRYGQPERESNSERWAAATEEEIRSLAQAAGLRLPDHITNPRGPASQSGMSISSDYYRNFFLTTRIEDFLNLGNAGRNVVLQSRSPRSVDSRTCTGDDGSLSIALRDARYINIEIAGRQFFESNIVAFNIEMAKQALDSLGIRPTLSEGPNLAQDPITSQYANGLNDDELEYRIGYLRELLSLLAGSNQVVRDNLTTLENEAFRRTAPQQLQRSPLSASSRESINEGTPNLLAAYPGIIRTKATPNSAAQKNIGYLISGSASNQSIKRRIRLGPPEADGSPPPEMSEDERTRFIREVRARSLSAASEIHRNAVFSQPESTERILQDMVAEPRDLIFSDQDALVAEIIRRTGLLYSTEGERMRYLLGLTDPSRGPDWIMVNRGSYLRPAVSNAFTLMQTEARRAGIDLEICSATRSFDYQANIWRRKMAFDDTFGRFGQLEPSTEPVLSRCARVLRQEDRTLSRGQTILEWDPSNPRHRLCWNTLNEAERAAEILKTSAAPGTSRHHWGTDIDLTVGGISCRTSLTSGAWTRENSLIGAYNWLVRNAHRFGFYQPYTPIQRRSIPGYIEEKWHWSYTPFSQPLMSEYQRLLGNQGAFRSQITGPFRRALGQIEGLNIGDVENYIVSNYLQYVSSVAQPSLLSSARKGQSEKDGINGSNEGKQLQGETSTNLSNREVEMNVDGEGYQPLPESLRSFFELRFHRNFDTVRLHTDSRAAKDADALNARAFTIGRDVFFGQGQYQPEKVLGLQLLAHELTHVIQQGSAPMGRAFLKPKYNSTISNLEIGMYDAAGKRDNGSISKKITPQCQSQMIAREEAVHPRANPLAQQAAQNIRRRLSSHILIDMWGGDCRDNNKNGRVDSDDNREPYFGGHIGRSMEGFSTINGSICRGEEGTQVITRDFNTNEAVTYSVCARVVSEAYENAGIPVPITNRVREIVSFFQNNNVRTSFWLIDEFRRRNMTYLEGDFICSYDPQSLQGHAGMVVQSGNVDPPPVIHLPGTTQRIWSGVHNGLPPYDPTSLSDMTYEIWPERRRPIYGIGRYI
jgi:LAS superfamily LD-carboxypeptidase LdcB